MKNHSYWVEVGWSQKHNYEQKKQVTEKHMQCKFVFIKFKTVKVNNALFRNVCRSGKTKEMINPKFDIMQFRRSIQKGFLRHSCVLIFGSNGGYRVLVSFFFKLCICVL